MTMQRRQFLTRTVAAAGLGVSGLHSAQAQANWPTQQIRWVVPYPAGGGTDTLARALAEAMRPILGQPLVIDNRPGASTNIGAELVARARPDGHTVMSADNAVLAFNEHLFGKLSYTPESDFTYVGGFTRFPLALVVGPKFQGDYQAFMAHVRANPGKVNYASPGNGSPHHLAMELFKNRTGAFITHIPYRGAAPALQDVMSGQVDCMFLDLAAGLSTIQAGKVRALAIGTGQRIAQLPNVPTLTELGVPDAEVYAFQGMLAPAKLPQPIVQKLNDAINQALKAPEVIKRLDSFAMQAQPGTPEEFFARARAESKRWGAVIKAAGIKLD